MSNPPESLMLNIKLVLFSSSGWRECQCLWATVRSDHPSIYSHHLFICFLRNLPTTCRLHTRKTEKYPHTRSLCFYHLDSKRLQKQKHKSDCRISSSSSGSDQLVFCWFLEVVSNQWHWLSCSIILLFISFFRTE